MNQKIFLKVTLVIFLLIALLHVLRLIYSWDAVIGGFEIPMWLSGLSIILALYLAYSAFKLKDA